MVVIIEAILFIFTTATTTNNNKLNSTLLVSKLDFFKVLVIYIEGLKGYFLLFFPVLAYNLT